MCCDEIVIAVKETVWEQLIFWLKKYVFFPLLSSNFLLFGYFEGVLGGRVRYFLSMFFFSLLSFFVWIKMNRKFFFLLFGNLLKCSSRICQATMFDCEPNNFVFAKISTMLSIVACLINCICVTRFIYYIYGSCNRWQLVSVLDQRILKFTLIIEIEMAFSGIFMEFRKLFK